ncbi:MAG: DEAD/DEAH box helicase [Candidatus Dojkabacteria bacterium]
MRNCYDAFQHSKSQALVVPTGFGKTHLAGLVMRGIHPTGQEGQEGQGCRTLILTSRAKLVDQNTNSLQKQIPYLKFTKNDNLTGDGVSMTYDRLINLIYQVDGSAKVNQRLLALVEAARANGEPIDHDQFINMIVDDDDFCNDVINYEFIDANTFHLIILDEAHNALSPLRAIAIKILQKRLTLGTIALTATPEYNGDKNVNSRLAPITTRLSVRESVEAGFLAPFSIFIVSTRDIPEEDLQQVETIESTLEMEGFQKYGIAEGVSLPNDDTFEWYMTEYSMRIALAEKRIFLATACAYRDSFSGQQGVVHCRNIRSAILAAEVINHYNPHHDGETSTAAVIHGQMTESEKEKLFALYAEGKIKLLCFADLLSEGFDAPMASVLFNCRPTRSRLRVEQVSGRVLRLNLEDHSKVASIIEYYWIPEIMDSIASYRHIAGSMQVAPGALPIPGNGSVSGRAPDVDPVLRRDLYDTWRSLVCDQKFQRLNLPGVTILYTIQEVLEYQQRAMHDLETLENNQWVNLNKVALFLGYRAASLRVLLDYLATQQELSAVVQTLLKKVEATSRAPVANRIQYLIHTRNIETLRTLIAQYEAPESWRDVNVFNDVHQVDITDLLASQPDKFRVCMPRAGSRMQDFFDPAIFHSPEFLARYGEMPPEGWINLVEAGKLFKDLLSEIKKWQGKNASTKVEMKRLQDSIAQFSAPGFIIPGLGREYGVGIRKGPHFQQEDLLEIIRYNAVFTKDKEVIV